MSQVRHRSVPLPKSRSVSRPFFFLDIIFLHSFPGLAVCAFPIAAGTDHHQRNGLKQHPLTGSPIS